MQKIKDFFSYFRAKREIKIKDFFSYFRAKREIKVYFRAKREIKVLSKAIGSYIGIRKFLFLLFFSLCLIGSIFYSLSFLQSVFLCLLVILLWKIFLGLSWFNFIFLFLSFLEANILVFFVKPLWVIGFVLIFLGLFWKKLFFSSSKEKYWQELLFYYLFLFWIIISYGFYFFLNYPFLIGFLVYALGLIGFSYFYFFVTETLHSDFLPSFLIIVLINLEFFLFLSCLSVSTLVLGILSILVFRFIIYFFQYEMKEFF